MRGGVITGSGRTAAAISAATHCLEQYNSGDVVSPSTAGRSRYATLRHPPHASSGWGEPPLGVHLKDLCSELPDALAGFCGAGDGDAVAELQ